MIYTKVVKPVTRYYGGKFKLAPWIIQQFPRHKIYVEPYGGAASVLLRKLPSMSEVYNDLDDEVVTLFRVLRDPSTAAELYRRLKFTPFARTEFELAYQYSTDPVEVSRRLLVRGWMGQHGTSIFRDATGFISNVKTRTPHAKSWRNFVVSLPAIVERFQGVCIECRPALDVIAGHDTPKTLFYLDPPYHPDSRHNRRRYRHEMDAAAHRELGEVLHGIQGMAILSGYDTPLYEELYKDWKRVECTSYATNGGKRTEVLWISPRTVHALERERNRQMGLFEVNNG